MSYDDHRYNTPPRSTRNGLNQRKQPDRPHKKKGEAIKDPQLREKAKAAIFAGHPPLPRDDAAV
jgi:hypothetical protein